MKHYPHHIGDFDKATRHLTRIERSIYRDLIEIYYDTEIQLTLDIKVLCRLVLARSDEESTAVEQVLNEFFNETPTGWFHSRCETEIEKYKSNSSAQAKAGKASAAARALKAQQALNSISTDVEHALNVRSTNRKPETVNRKQEPIKNITAEYSAGFEVAWSDYPTRSGASKKSAFKAWQARIKSGVDENFIIDGVRRYANYCSALKTEDRFIKQAETFFGPNEHYLAEWSVSSLPSRGNTLPDNFDSKKYGEGITFL